MKFTHHRGHPRIHAALLATMISVPLICSADRVSTAQGNGADIEMRERTVSGSFSEGASNGTAINTRTSSAGDRNEVVGLRMDLTGYAMAELTNVTLNLTSFRDDAITRSVTLHGIRSGTTGGTGSFTTDTWSESAVSRFGDLPGLLASDDNPATQSTNAASLTYLGQISVTGASEGDLQVFDSPAITSFIRSQTGSPFVSFLLTAGSGSSGQFRIASREASALAATITGASGDFAPYLEFEAAPFPPQPDLQITNIAQVSGGVALAGVGGASDGNYVIVSATNPLQSSTLWSPLSTNQFNGDGTFNVTNPVLPGTSQQFFRLLSADGIAGPDFSLTGFATVGGKTTGGAGGATQTVTTAAALISAVQSSTPQVVQVLGTVELNGGLGSVNILSDKTIVGLGTNASISGQLQISGASNVIIRNLSISNNAAPSVLDGIRIVNGSHHVWVDHCTFIDCSDGSVDITVASDYVTISWCTFSYVNQTEHRFANLIAASETDSGDYRITFHHNWWSTGCDQRMPASRYGTVHLFNNYYYAPDNSYCSNARTNAQFLSEHNVYREVDDPIYKSSNGRIRTVGNTYQNCTGQIDTGTDILDPILSPPPYTYTLDAVADVPTLVPSYAGAGRGPFAP